MPGHVFDDLASATRTERPREMGMPRNAFKCFGILIPYLVSNRCPMFAYDGCVLHVLLLS